MLRYLLFILNFFDKPSLIKTYPALFPKENSFNDFCQESSSIITSKIVYYCNNSQVNYTNCCFNNIPQSNPLNGGGAAHIMNASQIYINFCTFSNNKHGANGGAIFFTSALYIIDHCTFYNNRALSSGGAIFSSDFQSFPNSKSKNEIRNAYFAINIAKSKGGGIYYNNYTPLYIKNVTFELNEALNGASIYSIATNQYRNSKLSINIQACIFHINFTSSQARIKSNIEITNYKTVNFTNCQFKSFSLNSEKRIFYHLLAPESFAYFKGKNFVDSSNSTFLTSNQLFTNVIFNYNFDKLEQSNHKAVKEINLLSDGMYRENIVSNRQQYIEIENNVRIIKSKFSRISSDENGGAVYLAFCPRVSIKSASFISIDTTMNGGSIYANQSQIEMFDSNFTGCSCLQEGGAIFIDVQYDYLSYFNIMNCIFEKNDAKLNGGALTIKNSLNLLIGKCTFKSNYADLNGLSIYSYGVNDFNFILIASSFVSNSDELKKSEIDLNSFQIFLVQNCFFTSYVNNSNELIGKIYLKGKDVILCLFSGCCCLNTSEKSSIQMNVFNPFDQIHLNCTNHTFDQKKSSNYGTNSTNEKSQNDQNNKNLVSVIEVPKKNVFMREIESDLIVIFNGTVNDDYELKKFGRTDRVLPLLNKEINVTLFSDQNDTTSYESLFLSPLINDSKIYIQNENDSIEQEIGFLYQNISSTIFLNQNNSLISVKGIGNVTFSTSKNNFDYINLNNITVSLPTPLNLSFSEQFKSISIKNIHFYIRGSLILESEKTFVEVKNVTVHQEAKVKINSLELKEKMIFKSNSYLEVTDEIKFNEQSVIVFEFNESTKIGNFFHHKDDKNESKNFSIGILTIPSFSRETSGIPKKIIIREGEVITNILTKPSTEYYSPSNNLNHFDKKLPITQSYNSNKIKIKSILQNSLHNSKLQSSSSQFSRSDDNDNFDDENSPLKTEIQSNGTNYSLNHLPLICSDDFDFDFCTSLVSSNKNDEILNPNANSDFIVFENGFAECDCFINELNQTCIIIIDSNVINDDLKYVSLSTNGLVGVIFGSLASIAALLAIIFIANGKKFLSFSDIRL